ncbi:MAG: acyl--CoA ligase, partial [Acidimicrobiales bacterium]|nr:acyl--CoA ligase [Acidimicrobiales bacterium]
MNIMMLLEMASSGFGDRVALGDRTTGLTYTQLFDRVGRAATTFATSGADHVVLAGESSPALPIALFGSSWVGRPFVPLNYRLDSATLVSLAERAAPSYAVCDLVQEALLAPIDGVQTIGRQTFLDQLDSHEPAAPEWGFDGEDTAILLFTSGTTGEPKAAVLRQKHLVSYILTSVEFMGAGEDEATLVSVPPYHVAGIAAMLSSIYAGRR